MAMTTTTSNTTLAPEEALRQAFLDRDDADNAVAEHEAARAEAQKKSEAASALHEAAQVELKNVKARYNVLVKSAELASPEVTALEHARNERTSELSRTTAEIQQVESVRRSLSSMEALVQAAEVWLGQASEATRTLRESADAVDRFRPGGATAARLANIHDALGNLHNQLEERLGGLSSAHQRLRTDTGKFPAAVSPAEHLAALERKKQQLERELAGINRELEEKYPGVDPRHLQEAQKALDAANQAAQEGPKAVQRAEAEIHQASDSLARAQERRQAAQDRIDQASREFVEGIQVEEPDASGWATARALLKQDMKIPKGYKLVWEVEGASVDPLDDAGEKVRIDATRLRVGATVEVKASLQPQSKAQK
jgi:chromosome segregation ATPase